MQIELLYPRRWNTRFEPANAIFEYLESFHNRQRRCSTSGMLTLIEYGMLHLNTPLAWHPTTSAPPKLRAHHPALTAASNSSSSPETDIDAAQAWPGELTLVMGSSPRSPKTFLATRVALIERGTPQ